MNSVTADIDTKFYDMPEISYRTEVRRMCEPIYAYQAHFMFLLGGTVWRVITCSAIHPQHITSFPYVPLTSGPQIVQNHGFVEDTASFW